MSAHEPVSIACPYCGEALDIEINTDTPDQAQTEKCPVCRQPISVSTHVEDGITQVSIQKVGH